MIQCKIGLLYLLLVTGLYAADTVILDPFTTLKLGNYASGK